MSLHELVDTDQLAGLGEALAKRLANSTLPDEEVSPTSASTDSTEEGEDAEAIATADDTPVTDSDAGVVTSEDAASDEAEVGDSAVDQAAAESPQPTTIKIGDRDYTASDIEKMQTLYDWATKLPAETAQAMAAVELGQSAAVNLDEYRKFQAWQTTQSRQGGHQATNPLDDLLADLDPEQLTYVEQLRADNARLTQLAQQQLPDPAARQQVASGQQQWEAGYQTALDTWSRAHGVTVAQAEELAKTALDHNMFAVFAQQERQFNPINQQMIRDADPASVTTKALNYALASDPGLHEQITQQQQLAARQQIQDAAADSAVSQKKARAASLSTASGQATVAPPVDVRNLTPEQLKSGMSQMIAQMENIPQHE